jgi:hypothetical protein
LGSETTATGTAGLIGAGEETSGATGTTTGAKGAGTRGKGAAKGSDKSHSQSGTSAVEWEAPACLQLSAIAGEDLVTSVDMADHLDTSTFCWSKRNKPNVGPHTFWRGVSHGPNTTKESRVNEARGGHLETVDTEGVLWVSSVVLGIVEDFPKILHQTGACGARDQGKETTTSTRDRRRVHVQLEYGTEVRQYGA